ncbi:MAG TPA: RNA polymerase factor sigma-54 [Acetobacteraceae bacterium]|nr:RNA polymerase factor sigma-54 [Acetobacteraceae bacterium]
MTIGPRLEIRQSTTLVMTPQLRQAIKLLQLSNLDLATYVSEELERNPLLERDEEQDGAGGDTQVDIPALDQRADPLPPEADAAALVSSEALPAPETAPLDAEHAETYDAGGPGDGAGRNGASFEPDERGIENVAEGPRSLREYLSEQLRLAFETPSERLIGAHLIALLDPAGRLSAEPASLALALGAPLEAVERVRVRMLQFDPVGCFARDLRECLAAQLAERNRLDPAMAALLEHLDLLARREMQELREICGVDAEDLADMVAELRRLDPKPGTRFDAEPLAPLVPDILMRREEGGGFHLELNPDTLPRVLINHAFHARISIGARGAERSFLAERLAAANWLVRSLEQRAETILKVAAEIVRRQNGFFEHGIGHLRPLILRDVAEMVEMHESTVSRVTANKYIATPRGIFELKYFFTTAIAGVDGEAHSAEAVRQRIRVLVEGESPDSVLSDDAIVSALRREGVDIARRTVAKYREALRIPSSVQRRREKMASA